MRFGQKKENKILFTLIFRTYFYFFGSLLLFFWFILFSQEKLHISPAGREDEGEQGTCWLLFCA